MNEISNLKDTLFRASLTAAIMTKQNKFDNDLHGNETKWTYLKAYLHYGKIKHVEKG